MPRRSKPPTGDQPTRRTPAKPAAASRAPKEREASDEASRKPEPRAEEAAVKNSEPHAQEPEVANDPHPKPAEQQREEIARMQVDEPEAWDAAAHRATAARNAVFRPDPGVSLDDPQYRKDLRAWLDEWESVNAQAPVPQPGQDPHPPVVDGVPHVTQVSPETFDQQTPQIPWIPVSPGNMVKERAIATEPSVIQVPHPAPGVPPVSNEDRSLLFEQFPWLKDTINEYVRAAMAAERAPEPHTMREYLPGAPGEPFVPPDVLGHYRNDVYPRQRIQRMTVPDESAGPNAKLIYDHEHRGQYIQFVNGHFFATEPWQKEQLDWMASHPANHPLRPTEVLGGDPHIYEHVEDAPVYWCPTPGCDFVTASQKQLEAHRKATHGG